MIRPATLISLIVIPSMIFADDFSDAESLGWKPVRGKLWVQNQVRSATAVIGGVTLTGTQIETLTDSDSSIDDADTLHTHAGIVAGDSPVYSTQWQVTPNATTERYTFPTQTKRIKWALLFIDDRLYEYNSGATIRSATNPGFDAVQGATLGTHGGITVTSSLPWSVSSDDAVTANLIYQMEDSGIPESGSMFIPSMLVRASTETVVNPEPAFYWGGTTMTVMRY